MDNEVFSFNIPFLDCFLAKLDNNNTQAVYYSKQTPKIVHFLLKKFISILSTNLHSQLSNSSSFWFFWMWNNTGCLINYLKLLFLDQNKKVFLQLLTEEFYLIINVLQKMKFLIFFTKFVFESFSQNIRFKLDFL